MRQYDYMHMDVFAPKRMQGNGLVAVFCSDALSAEEMLDIAREFKQFETIFLHEPQGDMVRARIFTVDEELPFAGHPVLGGIAALHARFFAAQPVLSMKVQLQEKAVPVVSTRMAGDYRVAMQQGVPLFMGAVPDEDIPYLMAAHGLQMENLYPGLPVEVVTTGLPYVLIPIQGSLEDARITVRDLEARIAGYGAAFTYLFCPDTMQGRTWDNLGMVEDTATGSAAGPVCAYLCKHGRLEPGDTATLHQGQYANRPGVLYASMRDGNVYVEGDVIPFGKGSFTLD